MAVPFRIGRQRVGVGQYRPIYDRRVNKHDEGGADVDWDEYEDEPTHRHMGHAEEHPTRLKHRKESADPLHAEEDKLVMQYKALAAKAKSGRCTPDELNLLRTVKGRMMELNSQRSVDARSVYMGGASADDGRAGAQSSPGGVPVAGSLLHLGRVSHQIRPITPVRGGGVDNRGGVR